MTVITEYCVGHRNKDGSLYVHSLFEAEETALDRVKYLENQDASCQYTDDYWKIYKRIKSDWDEI